MDRIRILIADDSPLFRKGLNALLKSFADTELVGEATTGEEAVTFSARLQPDVILMDLKMPDVNGIEATQRIIQTSPHIGILVLTMFQDDDSVFAAMRAGARGYLLKGADQDEMLRAIRAVASGEAIFSRAIAQKLMHYFSSTRPPGPANIFPELTDREREFWP
jgi:DNA-binding NarL/FixJ family response regulator